MTVFTEFELLVLEKETVECDDAIAFFGDLYENTVPHSLRGRLYSHLNECPHCAKAYGEYRAVIAAADSLRPGTEWSDQEDTAFDESAPLPLGIRNRLRDALNRELNLSLALHAD